MLLRCAFPARPAVRKHREKFGGSREEDISAPPQEPQTHARISQANADAGWARSSPPAAAQRAPSAHGVGSQEVGALIAAGSAGSAEQRRERLPRAARVRLRSDYLTIQNRGRRVSGTNLMVFAVAGSGRMGITVSRKVGGAVERNHVKRCVREAYSKVRNCAPSRRRGVACTRLPSVDRRQVSEAGYLQTTRTSEEALVTCSEAACSAGYRE